MKTTCKKFPLLALFLSIIPGLGQFYCSLYKRGIIILSIIFVIIITSVILVKILPSDQTPFVFIIGLILFLLTYSLNILDAKNSAKKVNTKNGFQESMISDRLAEYGIFGKIALIFAKFIKLIFKITFFPIILIGKVHGEIYKCPKCGKPGAMDCIDKVCTGRSNPIRKGCTYVGGRKEYNYYEIQDLLLTYRCKYCGYEKKERTTKNVRLD